MAYFLVHRLNSKWSKKANKKKNLNIQGNIEIRRLLVKRAHVKFRQSSGDENLSSFFSSLQELDINYILTSRWGEAAWSSG